MSEYPAVLEKERDCLIAHSNDAEKKIKIILQNAKDLLKKDPDTAFEMATNAMKKVSGTRELLRTFKARLADFDKARMSHAVEIQRADQLIQDALAYLTGLKEKGYLVFPDRELAAARQDIKAAQDMLSERNGVPDYHSVIRYADSAAIKARTVQDGWEKRLGVQQANSSNLGKMRQWYEKIFPQSEHSYQEAFGRLKARTPSEVWQEVVRNVEIKNAKVKTEFYNLLAMADFQNGMNRQEFEAAGKTISRLMVLMNEAEAVFKQPENTLKEFAEAEIKAKNMASQAAQAIGQAERAVSDSDAEGAGRSKLQEAKENISKAKILEKSDLPNWLLLAGLLAGAVSLARSAENEARNKADEAERARRRKREEEERRRRDDYYHSSSSSWSSGSSSGGSFGGFGGGSFGGGGASGHW